MPTTEARQSYCRQCGNLFTRNRSDHWFCSPKCVAQYYRDNDNPDMTHASKEHIYWYECEQCKVDFVVNEYAKRGGKRAPKYCSVKCKQAAYRGRVKEQAARRQEQNTKPGGKPPPRNEKQQQQQPPPRNEKQQQQQPPPRNEKQHKSSAGGQSSFWEGYPTKWAAAQAILGVKHEANAKAIRAAWMKLLKIWHPDVNSSPEAVHMTQKINWAYEYLSAK